MRWKINCFRYGKSGEPERIQQIHALYELLHTAVDFTAALLFLVGSALFFREETTYVATWMFLVGSAFFGLKPTLKLLREIHYMRIGEYDRMFERVE